MHLKPLLPPTCAALLLAACTAAAPGDSADPCGPGEATVFACAPAPGHHVALCGSPDGSALQYRETGSGDGAGVAWPADGVPASQAFRSGTLMYSGGGGAFLRFDLQGRTHTVYTGIGRGWEKAGVLVQQDGRTVRGLACQGAVVSTIGPELFENASIPADDAGFEIP